MDKDIGFVILQPNSIDSLHIAGEFCLLLF